MRVINKYEYQKNCKIIDIWSDTDHSGCLETRTENRRMEGLSHLENTRLNIGPVLKV